MIVIKSDYEGDIRRFTLPSESLEFSALQKIIYILYKFKVPIKISYTDSEGDLVTIGSTNELIQACQEEGSIPKVLRIQVNIMDSSNLPTIPKPNSSKEETDPAIEPVKEQIKHEKEDSKEMFVNPEVSTQTNIPMQTLFASPQFQNQLEQLIADTVASPQFIEMFQKMLVPKMIQVMKENVAGSAVLSQDQASQANEDASLPKEDSKEKPLLESLVDFEKDQEKEEKGSDSMEPIKEEPEKICEKIIPKEAIEDMLKEQEKVLREYQQQQQADTKDVPQSDEKKEEDAFVIVAESSDSSNNGSPLLGTSPLKMLWSSLFKSNKKSRQDSEDDESLNIPNIEEVLQQLAAMGFTDKEANVKALRFHNKFKEGIHEVVDDLLIQSSINDKPQQDEDEEDLWAFELL